VGRQPWLREMDFQILLTMPCSSDLPQPRRSCGKPVIAGMQPNHARLRADPDCAVGLLQKTIHVRVTRVDAIAESQMDPVLRLSVLAVRHVHTICRSSPDPAAKVAPQEVGVLRSEAVFGLKVGRHPAALP